MKLKWKYLEDENLHVLGSSGDVLEIKVTEDRQLKRCIWAVSMQGRHLNTGMTKNLETAKTQAREYLLKLTTEIQEALT